jgi:RecA-family ATPase
MTSAKKWIDAFGSMPSKLDLIDEILPDSYDFMILAGRTGIGKTNLALQLAYCLATGTPFFGFKCQQVVVGYLGFEGSLAKMVDRLKKVGANFPDPGDNLRFAMDKPFILARKPEHFAERVEGCRVVILDPLRYLIGGDYCKPKDAVAFLGQLQNELARLKLTAIICHHVKKPNPNGLIEPGDIYDLKGATEYVDAATSVLVL